MSLLLGITNIYFALPLLLLPVMSEPAVQASCTAVPVAPTASEAPVLAGFDRRIEAYMAIHNGVERALAPQGLFEDPEDMYEALDAMRQGIRTARGAVRRGDIFTADVAAVIRARLRARLEACNQTVDEVLAFINEERLPGAARPRIGGPFPWELGSAMPATLLPALPALPEELQYRFADRTLVLIDMHADLVIDMLLNALPPPAQGTFDAHRR
jgi:hypothetical protein